MPARRSKLSRRLPLLFAALLVVALTVALCVFVANISVDDLVSR